MVNRELLIREATAADVAQIASFIRALAEYEKLAHEAVATEAQLSEHLFGARPCAEVLLAYLGDEPAGFALFFQNFSTFVGRPGLYLEDLFVLPEYRGRGIGQSLLARCAQIARAREYGRMEWAVLDWNERAIGFYRRLGARAMEDWTVNRLTGDALDALARLELTTD